MCSPVFRDAQRFEAKGSDSTISIKYTVTLLDSDFESASTFEAFLEISTAGKITLPSPDTDPTLSQTSSIYHKLFQFSSKWQCAATVGFLQQSLYRMTHEPGRAPLLAFVFGAYSGLHDLCLVTVKCHSAVFMTGNTSRPAEYVFNPQHWPKWVWEICPASHLAALVQAWIDVTHLSNYSLLPAKFADRLAAFQDAKN